MTVHGYIRVSTREQRDVLQQDALVAVGVERIWAEVASGAATSRPVLDLLLESVGDGDEVVVWRLDRLGRSLPHLLATVQRLDDAGVRLRSLHEQIDTRSATGRMMLGIFGVLAQFERELLIERTQAGLAAARASGKKIGRPRQVTPDRIMLARQLRDEGRSITAIAKELGTSRATVYRALQEPCP